MTPDLPQLLASLGFFKDWSNYLLVTTVAALGWVATKPLIVGPLALRLTVFCLCVSIVCAMLTLALIPLVGEKLVAGRSIYDTHVAFTVLWMWGPEVTAPLKWVCWPQHVFFLAGIIIFSFGTIWRASSA